MQAESTDRQAMPAATVDDTMTTSPTKATDLANPKALESSFTMALGEACRIVSHLCQEDRVAEQLEQQGVSDELLDMWRTAESKVLVRRNSLSSGQCSAPEDRQKAVLLLRCLVNGFSKGGSEPDLKQWFDAVLRLDVHLVHNPNALSGPDAIPILCAALVNLGQKVEGENTNYDSRSLTQHAKETMNHLLVSAGEPPMEMYSALPDIQATESFVLASVQWRLMLPTVSDWIKLMNTRLDTITCGQFQQTVAVLWRYSSAWAWTLAHKCQTTADSSPRQVAQGLICLACSFSGVVPAAPLDLEKVDLSSLGPFPTSIALPAMSSNGQAVFVAALLAATQTTFASLRQDASMVGDMLSGLTFPRPAVASV